MIPRPKATDTWEDVMEMTKDYEEKKKDVKFKPAARAVALPLSEPRQSVFAKRRNLKSAEGENKKVKPSDVIGDVVERKYEGKSSMDAFDSEAGTSSDQGFPKPAPIDVRMFQGKQGKSIFSQMIQSNAEVPGAEVMEIDDKGEASGSMMIQPNPDIHKANDELLSQMTEEEIIEERQKLINTMDPSLLEFIRSKRKSSEQEKSSGPLPKSPKQKIEDTENYPALDFLKNEQAKNWVHFDVLEPEKLEWTKNIQQTFANIKPGETYEARFNWLGFLQPYNADLSEPVKDDRELYLHGEEPNRPGYTLQEIFKLARSEVVTQRVAALGAIAGIINIYNQGYYDGILELPITKIFFFLRFALDEKIPAIVEVSSRALAYLFYNETDETLMDVIFETNNGIIQPVMNNRKASLAGSGQDDLEADLESSLKNMSLNETRKMFESTVEDYVDDEQETKNMNDYHLAELNLVELLIKTNIIERITYILKVMEPDAVGINSCIKILIRIARTGRDNALQILNNHNLIIHLIRELLPPVESSKQQHFIVLKLFRILSSFDRSFCLKLKNLDVVDIAMGFVSTKKDVSISLMKLQIESFRFLRLYFRFFPDVSKFGSLMTPMSYLLNWHYQHLQFEKDHHFIIRQHASSLLQLIICGNTVETHQVFLELIKMCCCKWFTMATRHGANEFSQKLLLATVLFAGGSFIVFNPTAFYEFVDNHLIKFLKSTHYDRFVKELTKSSPLFHNGTDRCNILKPLINLGSIVRRYKKSAPTLVLSQNYSVHFMDALLDFIDKFDNMIAKKNYEVHHKLCDMFFNEDLEKYMEGFSLQYNRDLSTNWFLKTEINFVYKLMNARSLQFNPWILKVAFNLLNCFTQENLTKILEIFRIFIFNDRYYFANNVKTEEYERWRAIYNAVVASNLHGGIVNNVAVVSNWNQILLDEAWPFSILLILLRNAEVDGTEKKKTIEIDVSEEEIIVTSLKFTLLLEKNKVNLITTNQQLMYLMLVYFGENLNFLDAPVKALVRQKLKAMKRFTFPTKFNFKLNNEKSFESLYTMFLDTFQSNSYGDDVFSILVMIPLAQKYDVKWRKLVWSEYIAVMKFVGCTESDLLEDFTEYLYPAETDKSLLDCYSRALATNSLRKDSLPWKIAVHHIKNANKSSN